MGSVILPDNQTRVKDSFATSQIIDLTVRANGEEKVKIIDAQGLIVQAGIDAPTVAPTTAIGAATGLTPSLWVAYRYVYAATSKYPKVQNAVTGGGDLSPRSNPSPLKSQLTDAAVGGKKINLTMTKSLRPDVDKIWLYRTDYYATQVEAEDAATAGRIHWLATIANPNDGVAGTVSYTDETVTVTGGEEIELDNYTAPTFQFVLYAEPYFWGFGNFELVVAITVDATGLVTVTDSTIWFDGRNSQLAKMDGITTGGFDGYGSYYFKQLTGTTGQLYFDSELTTLGSVNYTGDTFIHIQGLAATLFRSKPNNPFSWGETNIVNELTIPELVAIEIGGGSGTAMAIVPSLNLLKLDTEKPNKSYVLNLRAAGTDGFVESKREVSSIHTASNHWAQLETLGETTNVLFFYDSNTSVIGITDGSSVQDISGPVFESLRDINLDVDTRLQSHMIFDAKQQILVIWIPVGASGEESATQHPYNFKALIYHYPTKTWSTWRNIDSVCSATIVDTETNERKTLIGTDLGRIGRIFSPNQRIDWLPEIIDDGMGTLTPSWSRWPIKGTIGAYPSSTISITLLSTQIDSGDWDRLVGTWCYVTVKSATNTNLAPKYLARIATIAYDGISDYTIVFDYIYTYVNPAVYDYSLLDFQENGGECWIFPGATLTSLVSYLPYSNTYKVLDLWANGVNIYQLAERDSAEVHPYIYNIVAKFHREIETQFVDGSVDSSIAITFTCDLTRSFANNAVNSKTDYYSLNPLTIDSLRTVGLELIGLGYSELSFNNLKLTLNEPVQASIN